MAYFKAKDLKLGTSQSVYFGDGDQARLWFDGTEWAATHTISGTAATADYHLIQKGQVDTIASGITDQIITEHSGLSGLTTGDDHTQYSLATGSRAFTGTVGGVTPTADSHLTTKQYVDSIAQGLDWQDSVLSKSYTDPTTISGGYSTGDRYIIDSPAAGAWAGNAGGVAEWNGSTWDVSMPNEGFAAWVEDEDILYVYNGSAWVKFGSTVTHGNLLGLDQDDHPQYHDDTRGDARYYTQSQVDTIASGVEAQIVTDHGALYGLGDDDHVYYVPTNADRGFTATVSGINPTQDYHLATKWYIDNELATISGGIVQDHGLLTGLTDDDHAQYILATGSRAFTGVVGGITPTADAHLTTKQYVDGELATVSGAIVSQIPSIAGLATESYVDTAVSGLATESYVDNHNWYEADILDLDKYTQVQVDTMISGVEAQIITDHGGLTGLVDDDHTQYILVDGTRGFTATVSGITPTEDAHLATKWYVDDEIATLSGSMVMDHGGLTGLGDDDHTQYILVDGSRGFAATVSGVTPVQDYHLTTKSYVDSLTTDKVQSGRTALADNDETKSITFGTAFADTNYSVSAMLNNVTDANPGIYPMVVSVKSTTGFTVVFSGKIDSNNYYVEWIARHD